MRPLVRKKDDGYQLILSFKSNGKWRQRSKQGFETEPEAWAYLPELVEAVKKSFVVDSEMENLTVKDFIEIFIEDRSFDVKGGTLTTIKQAYANLEPIESKKMKDVTYHDILKIINDFDYKLGTSKLYTIYIKQLFRNAVKPYKVITDNPAEEIKYSPKTNKQEEKNTLTLAQANQLFKDIENYNTRKMQKKEDYYLFTKIAFSTGLRLGEALGLTWADVDFKNQLLTINKQLTSEGDLGDLKTGNSYRTVPFSNSLKTALLNHRGNVIALNERVLSKLNNKNSTSTSLVGFYKRLGYNITPHDLRHSYATICIGNGMDIKTVASLLGDTVETVFKTYLHFDEDMRVKASEDLKAIFK